MTNRDRMLGWLVRFLAERAEEDSRQAEQDARDDAADIPQPDHGDDECTRR